MVTQLGSGYPPSHYWTSTPAQRPDSQPPSFQCYTRRTCARAVMGPPSTPTLSTCRPAPEPLECLEKSERGRCRSRRRTSGDREVHAVILEPYISTRNTKIPLSLLHSLVVCMYCCFPFITQGEIFSGEIMRRRIHVLISQSIFQGFL